MKSQKVLVVKQNAKRQEQELLARSLMGISNQESSTKKYLDLKGWKPCLSLFLAANYAFMSISIACESVRKPDQENFHRRFLENSKSQLPTPLNDITNVAKQSTIKTNIPLQYLKITEKGIYIEDQLKSLEKDLFIEAASDIYLQRLQALGNLTVSTPGRIHVIADVLVDGTTTLKAKEIDVAKRLKGRGNIQLFAESTLGIAGYVKSKSVLQLVGIGEVNIHGFAKGNEGVITLSTGKVIQNGTVISKKEYSSQSKDFSLGGAVLSHEGARINTQEVLEARPGSSIGSKGLSLVSQNNKILLHGETYVEGEALINSPGLVDVLGHFKSTENVAIQADSLSTSGLLEALNGATFSITQQWDLLGALLVKGKGLQGKVGNLILKGLLETNGVNLTVEKGSNQGAMLTRGHCNLTGKTFTHHKGSTVFTTGVHYVDFVNDYQDASQLFTPTLFIANANHLMFLPGFEASLKDALLSSKQQTTVYQGANFNLFGPTTFLQISSEGSATFLGQALQDSLAQFSFKKYLECLGNYTTVLPTVSDLQKEVTSMALTHPWRALRKGMGISIVVGGDVKYAGVSKLDGGSINLNASQTVHSQYGSMQAGGFTGHNVGISAANAILSHMDIKSYLDKVTVITTESLKIKDTEISGGLQTLISSINSDIEQSRINSSAGEISLIGTALVRVKDSRINSHKDISMRGGQVGVSGSAVKSEGHAFLESDSKLAVDTSQFETHGNHLSGEDISVRQVITNGDTTMDAKNNLLIEDYKSADHLAVRSGNKTTYNGRVETEGLDSQAKHIENNAQIHTSEAAQLVTERFDHNNEIVSETVFIQADEFYDKETSKAKGLKTLVLINEKGKGIAGTLEGETVVIKMEDFQLKALKQVVAKITQLHINSDIVVNEDLILNNTLHLWANSLIQKGKISAMGDLIAQFKEEISLYDIMNIKGTGALIAGGNFKIDRGQVTAEKLYLQSKTKDVTLFRAALKALSDIKISADQGNIKKTSSEVHAGRDVGLKAGRNIESRSEIERVGSGNNYTDKKVTDRICAGGNLSQEAGGHIAFAGVENKAGGNINYQAGGNVIDTPVALETQYSQGDSENFDKGTRVTQSVSTHQAGGDFVSTADGSQELYAPEISGSRIKVEGKKQVNVHDVHDTKVTQSQYKSDGGFFGQDREKQEASQSAQSKGAKFYGTKKLEIIAGEGMNLTNITSTAPQTSLMSIAGAVRILMGKNQSSYSSNEKSSNILWNRQTSHVEEHKTFSASTFGGSLEIHSKEAFVESIKGQTLDFTKQLEAQGINVIHTYLDEFHKSDTKTVQGPSKALAAVVVLAVSICTAGTGAAIGGAVAGGLTATGTAATIITGMTAAAFTSICSQAALALLANEGNIVKAAESLASTKTLENIGLSMLSAGITAGVTDALHIPQSSAQATTMQQIERQAIQSTVGLTTNLITGQKLEDALLQAAKSTAAGVVSGVASRSIGDAYKNHDVDFIGHKFLHALVGGATGAILSDDPLRGAASGAFGAVTAEMVGELVLMNSHNTAGNIIDKLAEDNIPITSEAIQNAIAQELTSNTNFIKLLTSGIALLTGQDVSISNFTACSALDNNFSKMASTIIEQESYSILENQGANLNDRGIFQVNSSSFASHSRETLSEKEIQELGKPEASMLTAEDIETAQKILEIEGLGIKASDLDPETLKAFSSILRNASLLDVFREDPTALYKYLSKVHLESYAKGEGINPIGIKTPTKTSLPVEEITVRHARPGDIKNKGTDRTSWTTDPDLAVDIAKKDGASREQVVVTSEKKLEAHGVETKNTTKLVEEADRFEKIVGPDHKGVSAAKHHYPDKKEVQTVGGVANEATRKLRIFEGRGPLITKTANVVLPTAGKVLGGVGMVATLTQDSPVNTVVTDPMDVHYIDQAFKDAAWLVEKLILSFGGTITYVNPITNEKEVVHGKPFWEKK